MIDPAYNWTGFYVGLNAGGAFGRTGAGETGLPNTGGLAFAALADYSLNHNLTGGFGGAQAGYNRQVQNFVWGVEADIQGADIRGAGTFGPLNSRAGVNPTVPGSFVSVSEKVDFFGTARLRAGFLATPALLLYGTGGLAYGNVKTSGQAHFPGNILVPGGLDYLGAGSRLQVGWTLGAGAEFKLAGNWSVKGEYLYYDFGHTSDISNLIGQFQSRFDYNPRGSLARIGVDYQFASPIVAKY